MSWWKENNLRLIQNNLREVDANLDVDLLMEELKDFSTNVLMMNAGGIFAFYPTKLEYHYRTPLQNKDLLQEAITKAHQNGMKFIARFDFSKAHESIYQKRPEWFYKSKDGQEVNYFGIVHTCINGYYQREYSLQIIDEVLSNYDVDGIFFNMFGYQNWDYSGNYYGTCYCNNCKARFKEMFQLELPDLTDANDPVYQQYREFQSITTMEMLDSIHKLVKSKEKDIAISTYHTHHVDIVREESNTALRRPYPKWLYSASENVKTIEDSWEDKLISNCSINAIDLHYRFTGVSKNEVKIRLYESIASGSGLDFCIIGVFEDYPDRENLEDAKKIFRLHQQNEQYYGQLQSLADVALVKPNHGSEEYRGLFKLLKEDHIQFDVITHATLLLNEDKLKRYKAILIPHISRLKNEELQLLKKVQDQGVVIIATGESFMADETNQSFLKDAFGASLENSTEDTFAAYFKTENKEIFKRFKERDWVILDSKITFMNWDENIMLPLTYVNPSSFGPPERAYGHEISSYAGAGIAYTDEKVKGVYLPWQVGEMYYKHGFEDQKNILLDLLDYALNKEYTLKTNASHQVEVFYNKIDEDTLFVQLLNLSGFNGTTYLNPIPVRDIKLTLRDINTCQQVKDIMNDNQLSYLHDAEGLTIQVDELEDYAAIVIKL